MSPSGKAARRAAAAGDVAGGGAAKDAGAVQSPGSRAARGTPRQVVDPYTPAAGDARWSATHYDLDVDYRMATNRLDGVARITGRAHVDLSAIELDLVGLRASRVTLDGVRVPHVARGGKLVVQPAAPLPAGSAFALEVVYAGAPKPRRTAWGLVGWEELEDGVIVASQPTGAPTWFPCNDRPANKATYRIRITTEQIYRVVATGALVDEQTRSGRTSSTFACATPAATYLISVQIGHYVRRVHAGGDVPVAIVYPPALEQRVQADLDRLPEMVALFSERFGPYPFPDYTVVVTADDLEIPLESQGAAVFGANLIDGHGSEERLVAHELAHQWFGNSVGVESWQHIWLNEGLACYAEWMWSEAAGRESADALARAFHKRLAGLPQDIVLGDPGAALMFDDRIYKRGALLVHALRLTIGERRFWALLHEWTAKHAFATVTTDDFCELAARIGQQPLDALFDAWLVQTALPPLPGDGKAKRKG
ncbi:M1 family metallopeptidase [Agrococcus beijingensis]|uniref:M1 family metallopeptidase n=1 Tax=Agrococcus beijingensis TaxID=3068634 RepID=UPI00274138FE|nr:M1 family metallopeptidase [Agrococcus sp. REN33]